MNQYKLLARRIGLVGLTNLMLSLNGIVLLPILTKNLSVSEYGIWVQILVTVGLVPAVALAGLPYSMVRFLPSAKDIDEVREAFYSITLVILGASLFVSLGILVLSGPISSALFDGDVFAVRLLSSIVFIECLNTMPINYFRTFQKIKRYAAFSSLRLLLNVPLVALFVVSGYGIHGALWALLITVIVIFLGSFALVVSDIGIKFPKFYNMREYLSFGIPTVPGNLSSWVVNSSDRYVIGLLLGTVAVGYYSPGYTLGNMVSIFVAPISFMLPAVLSKYYDEQNMAEVVAILRNSMRYFLIIGTPTAFGLSILSRPILTELTIPAIADRGYLITPFVAFGGLLLGIYAIVSQVIVLEKRTRLTGSVWIVAAVLNLGLNFLLVPFIGILGAAMTTLLAFFLATITTYYYASKYLKFSLERAFSLKVITASAVMSIPLLLLAPKGLPNILIAVAIGALVYFIVLLSLKGLKRDEVAFMVELLKG